MSDGLFARAAALRRFMTDTRRALHMIPEQSFRETDTRRYLLSLFSDAECEKRELSCGSVALFFDFGKENTAAFRCELDALPVNELNESAYKSNRKGFMHACGHDGHMAVCAALCRVLDALSEEEKSKAKRNALVLFQSGEESAGGAQAVVDSGILAETRTDRIFALHLWPKLKKGEVYSTAGVCLAQNAEVDITISCPQSHAADNGADSLAEAARLLLSLEKEVSETASAKSPCLLKFGRLTGCEICRTSGLAAEIRSYCVVCGTEWLCHPTPSSHRLRRGLPGYLILFAPHAFEPQRQLPSSKPPSPLVFLLISTHFTATLGIPLPSPVL